MKEPAQRKGHTFLGVCYLRKVPDAACYYQIEQIDVEQRLLNIVEERIYAMTWEDALIQANSIYPNFIIIPIPQDVL